MIQKLVITIQVVESGLAPIHLCIDERSLLKELRDRVALARIVELEGPLRDIIFVFSGRISESAHSRNHVMYSPTCLSVL